MANGYDIFDVYERYHDNVLTDEEKQLQAEAMVRQAVYEKDFQEGAEHFKNVTLMENGYVSEGAFVPSPEFAFRRDVALDRADAQMKGKPLPDDIECIKKYPSVNPWGKYTDKHMELSYRLQQVKNKTALRPQEFQDFMAPIMKELDHNYKGFQGFGGMRSMAESSFQNVRRYERAAKVALDRDTSKLCIDLKERAEQGISIQQMDNVVTALEQLSGLKPGEPDEQMKDFFASTGHTITPEVLSARSAMDRTPDQLNINFTNVAQQINQQFFCNPVHWNDPLPTSLDEQKINISALDQLMNRYACATVDDVISTTYSPFEHKFHANDPETLNRGTTIMVDGKTVEERMHERFDQLPNSSGLNYQKWYAENCRQMTSEMVSSALMANKRVECFVPDANGKLPKEPVQITRDGYEPKPVEKVVLNAWERHFAKHGFYKEKAAKADEYKRIMDCRERVQVKSEQLAYDTIYNPSKSFMQHEFFLDVYDKVLDMTKGMPHAHYRGARSSPVSACVYGLAAQGYSFEDIMDPDKLREEKLLMGREYAKHARDNDEKWIGTTLAEGHQKYMEFAQKAAEKWDFSDVKDLAAHRNMLEGLSYIAFDASQDATYCRNSYAETAKKYCSLADEGKTISETFMDNALQVSGYFQTNCNAIKYEHSGLALPVDMSTQLSTIAAADVLRQVYSKSASPDFLGRLVPNNMFAQAPGNIICNDNEALLTSVASSPEKIDAAKKLAKQGQTSKLFHLKLSDTDQMLPTTELSLNEKTLSKMGVKSKSEKQQNAPKQRGR